MPVLILHYHEIWLKGCNRAFFVQKLKQAVRSTLAGLPIVQTDHENNRMVVTVATDAAADQACERLQKVPGIAYLAVGQETAPTVEAIVSLGTEMLFRQPFQTFAVRARRSEKSFPFRSGDIERALGTNINEQAAKAGSPVKVNLGNPDATCFVEVTPGRALIYSAKIPGVGGLPTGSAGKLVCMLSGGFDSAVAAYKLIKRGARLTFVHFYGAAARPGEDSPPVARDLARVLTLYQGRSRLYLVPFTDVQRAVVAGAPDAYRILIYRRMMLRIAEKIARRHRAHGLVTGDSVAQVASQTLQNLEAVGAATQMPLYRPLIGDDKQEILDLARKIGTYEISSEPFTDCCPMFLPKSPKIFSTRQELDAAESGLPIEELVRDAVRQSQREIHEYQDGEVRQLVPAAYDPKAVAVAGD
jgi:thiamine biosynthesis protein ThiI